MVKLVTINASHAGQRIDNYLLSQLKGVPKSWIYRIIRKGEVRINKKRVDPAQKLAYGDEVRIPPVRIDESPTRTPNEQLARSLEDTLLYEDDNLLIINKPAGIAVHSGSNISHGVIELLRHLRPYQPFLELAHRLDKETSGCLVLAKNRPTLLHIQQAFKEGKAEKTYLALVHGQWPKSLRRVEFSLAKGQLQSGERMVKVEAEKGKTSLTYFKVVKNFGAQTLLEAQLDTGRTHQIRVHAAESGYPLVGDEKYGNREQDKLLRKIGAKGLYLHASSIELILPHQKPIRVKAPTPATWNKLMTKLEANE